MVLLFYLMVVILTIIQQTMSQEGNFALFGDAAGDTRFTRSLIMGERPRYIKWTLPDDHSIQAFNKSRRKILVSRWLQSNIFTVKETRQKFFNAVQNCTHSISYINHKFTDKTYFLLQNKSINEVFTFIWQVFHLHKPLNSFKGISHSMKSLKIELMIHVYRPHTKSIFLVILFRLP